MFPALPDSYVSHLVAPRHIGDLQDAHAAGEVGSMVGGLGVRMTLRFVSEGDEVVVAEAQGRTFGSLAPLPALSWLAEAVRGMPTTRAGAIAPADVEAGLLDHSAYELTDRARLGAEMAVEALRSALGAPDAEPPADPTGHGILVCRCLGVGDRTIRDVIQAGARSPEDIGLAAKACTGCRSCRVDLLALLDEELAADLPAPATDRHPVERITLTRARRVLRSLGAALEDAQVAGDTVNLHLGPFASRPMTTPFGAVAITRHVLREVVWEGARVALDGESDA